MHRLWWFCSIIALTANNAWAQSDNFYVSQFSDAAVLETCRSDLLEIDENGDMGLDRDEYAAFLQLQTGNQMTGDFDSITLRLESIYFAHACMCSVVDPNDNQCCLNGNDHIPLDTTTSSLIDPYLDFFCHNVEQALIAEGFNPVAVIPATATPTGQPTGSPVTTSPTKPPTNPPTLLPTVIPTLGPSDFPSLTPTDNPTAVPSHLPTLGPSDFPSLTPSNQPTELPSSQPTRPPSIVPTPNPSGGPSDIPTIGPSVSPTVTASLPPSNNPSSQPSEVATNTPTFSPSSLPSEPLTTTVPTEHPSPLPTLSPSVPPASITGEPTMLPANLLLDVDTLCVDFQYVVRNQVGLDADAIFNEENNQVMEGLKEATRNITIDILNGTYPGRRFLVDQDTTTLPSKDGMTGQLSNRRKLRKHPTSDRASFVGELGTKSTAGSYLAIQHRRKLAYYYTDAIPVTINSVTDNPLCAGSAQNQRIMCAIVSSTVCIVLEEGDDPDEVRALMIAGLRQAVDSGDFLRRIDPSYLQMT